MAPESNANKHIPHWFRSYSRSRLTSKVKIWVKSFWETSFRPYLHQNCHWTTEKVYYFFLFFISKLSWQKIQTFSTNILFEYWIIVWPQKSNEYNQHYSGPPIKIFKLFTRKAIWRKGRKNTLFAVKWQFWCR